MEFREKTSIEQQAEIISLFTGLPAWQAVNVLNGCLNHIKETSTIIPMIIAGGEEQVPELS